MAEAIWAAFEDDASMAAAVHALRDRGHVAVEAYSPFAVADAASAIPVSLPLLGPLRLRTMPLPWVALAAGVLGGAAGYIIQWLTNAVLYAQDAGGRPANAVPAFVFNTFESLVLVGACAVFFALLIVLRLPRLWEPRETIDGFTSSSDDRFCVLVADREPWLVPDATERLLRDLGAAEVRRVEVR